MDPTRALLQRQRQRLVASVLGHAERTFFAKLTAAEQQAFRSKVLASVDTYHDFMLDLTKVMEDQAPDVNQEAVRLIREMHSAMLGNGVT